MRKSTGEVGAKIAVHPLGLAHIASVLRNRGHEVEILDALTEGFHNEKLVRTYKREDRTYDVYRYGLSDYDIRRKIMEFNPDVVGVSCLQATRHHEANEVVNIAKQVNKKIITAIGGSHPSTVAEKMIEWNPNLDYVFVGESDFSFPDYLDGKPPDGVVTKGLVASP